jgi:UDP-glucose 4-epimerase
VITGPLRSLGLRIPDEMLNQLRFGRGLDNRRYKASGFEYGYTSRETVVKLAEHLRLHPILRGVEQSYTYEGEVERFLRRSRLTRPPEGDEDEQSAAEREPFGI